MPTTQRATPRYLRFLLTGALVGLVTAAVLTATRGDLVDSPTLLFFYLAVVLSGIGALLAAVVAVVLESRRRRGASGSGGSP